MKIARISVLIVASLLLALTQPSCTRAAKKERALGAALNHFNKGEFSAAEIEYKNALDADPGNPEAIKRIGMMLFIQGAQYEAAGALGIAKNKLPADDEIGIYLGRALLNLGFAHDSRQEVLSVLDRSPQNGEALLDLAESSVTAEWMEECEKRIKAAGGKSVPARLATALIELRRGAIETGTAMVDEILKTDPGLVRAHSLKAAILGAKKLPDEALAELKIAADLAGPRSNESIAYARALMTHEQRDTAVAYLEKLTVDTPDFLPAWSMLGVIAFSEKKDEEATKYLSKVLAKNPVDLASATVQAEVMMRNNQPAKAVEVLERVVLALPSRPQLEFALAKCHVAAGSLGKAAEALDRVLAAAPTFSEAGRLRAKLHLQDGKTAEGITALEAIQEREPGNAETVALLISAYHSAGRYDEAVALLREKSAANKEDSKSQIELGQLLTAQGKFDEAKAVFEKSVESFPQNFEALSNLVALDVKVGNGASALKRIDDYIVAHPESSEARTLKGGVALDLKQPEVAEQALTKAIKLKADNAQAYALLLRSKDAPGQEAAVLAILERFLKAFPGDPQASFEKGNVLQRLGRHEEARAAFSEVIAAAPEFASGFNNLAALESEHFHDLESAATHARKARSLDAAHPAIADTLGWIEWQLGNHQAALPLLTEAAGKMSDNPGVIYHLGMAQYSLGQVSESRKSLSKALETAAEFPEKADAQKHLALLGEADKWPAADLDGLQKRASDNPKDVMAHLQLADMLARSARPQDAADAFQKVLDLNPAIPAALIGQARLFAGPLKSPEKALQVAAKAREIAPNDREVLAALGFVKLLAGSHEEAYGMLKDASVSLDKNFTVRFDFARAAYSLGRIAEARAAMARVAASDDALSAEAKSFLILTDPEAPAKAGIALTVEESLAQDPANVPALMLRGSLESAAGKNPEATYLQVLTLHPQFDPARVRLAALYLEDAAKLDQAESLAREARSSLPEDPELSRILALISYRKGDFKYAAQLFAELAIKRPLAPAELLALGMSFANSNQPEKARQFLGQALQAGLSDQDAAQVKETLAKLETPEKVE